MSRRCKKGQRARIISDGPNRGKIVWIVRPYFYPEMVSDSVWPKAIFPWVVTSLGAPLRSFHVDTGEESRPTQTVVVDDRDLEPLDDGDDGLREQEGLHVPRTKNTSGQLATEA